MSIGSGDRTENEQDFAKITGFVEQGVKDDREVTAADHDILSLGFVVQYGYSDL